MTPLHGGPCLALTRLLFGRVAAFIADGGGIDEEFGATKCHEARAFGVPLIPTYLHAETTYAGVDGLEAEIAGGEVEFLVVGGVVGNVHLAIFACNRTVALKDYGGVVVETRCAALEERGDEHNGVAACEIAEKRGRGPRNGFGEIEKFGVFCLTEIGRVVQFLQHHEFGTAPGGGGNVSCEAIAVLGGIGHAGHLDKGYFHGAKCENREGEEVREGLVEANDTAGILHGDAMERTMLADEAATVDTYDFMLGEGTLQHLACRFVMFGLMVGG